MNEHICNFSLSILLLKEGLAWVAQCLEYDITGQGESINEALSSFECAFAGHVISDFEDGLSPLQGIEQAPEFYWSKYRQAEPLKKQLPIEIPSEVPAPWMIRATAQELRVS